MSQIILSCLLLLSIVVCTCMASYVHTVYQNIPDSIPQRNRTRFARQSNGLNYCGIRIDQALNSGEPLLADETCELSTNGPGYSYMLKEEVIQTQTKPWGFTSLIPICARIESSFEVLLTPLTGWSSFRIQLNKINWDRVMIDFIDPVDNIFEDNVLTSIIIEVNADSYKMYINGDEFKTYVRDPLIYPERLQMMVDSHIHIHRVIYRVAPTDSTP